MEDKNLQEQYALLEKEKQEDKKRTIILIILFVLIIFFTLLGLFFAFSRPHKHCLINCQVDGKWYNIDTNGDDKCDVNCKVTGSDGKNYMINIDYKNDRVAHFNLDTNGDGIPDTNLVNKDIDGDGTPDLNIDIDGDGYPDINIDLDNINICSLNCDTNGDNIADVNVDVNNDNKADINIDVDGNGKADINIDTNGDNKADINIDTNGDKKADLNVDSNGDGIPDINVDSNNDGICDSNCVDNLVSNANLNSIKVGNYVLNPVFDENKTDYVVNVDEDLKSVNVVVEAVNPKSKISGDGSVSLEAISTRVPIVVVAEDGTIKTYNLVIVRVPGDVSIEQNGNGIFEFDTIENNSLVVSYTQDINVENIIPGWSGTQLFTLTNKSEKTIVYNISLVNVINTFKSNNLKYTLYKDGKVIIDQTSALRSDDTIYEKLIIAPGESVDFELKLEFLETNQVQNEDYDVKYSSKVEIGIVSVN